MSKSTIMARYSRISSHNRQAGCITSPIEYTDVIVTDGRRKWCVTLRKGTSAEVRKAWMAHPVPGRPMRRCWLRECIVEAAQRRH